jgi:hypothetical protein
MQEGYVLWQGRSEEGLEDPQEDLQEALTQLAQICLIMGNASMLTSRND